MADKRYRLRDNLEITWHEGAPKSRGMMRLLNPDMKSPKSMDPAGAVWLDVGEFEVLFEQEAPDAP